MGNNHSRFSDGFLLGLLVGGIAVFLLGTKKGNKILKAITEDGLAGLGEIAKELENEAKKETKAQLSKIEDKMEEVNESIEVDAPKTNGESHASTPKSSKRFFRKSK